MASSVRPRGGQERQGFSAGVRAAERQREALLVVVGLPPAEPGGGRSPGTADALRTPHWLAQRAQGRSGEGADGGGVMSQRDVGVAAPTSAPAIAFARSSCSPNLLA